MQLSMTDMQEPDRNIESLARQINEVIEGAPTGEQEELRQMASDLVRQEVARPQSRPGKTAGKAKQPLSPIAVGLLVALLGAAIAVLMPFIGLTVVVAGLVTLALGAIYRAMSA